MQEWADFLTMRRLNEVAAPDPGAADRTRTSGPLPFSGPPQ